MKIKLNYLGMSLIVIAFALFDNYFYNLGKEWYDSNLIIPSLGLFNGALEVIWPIIYIATILLITFSMLIILNTFKKNSRFWFIIVLFGVNAFLNFEWIYTFFYQHNLEKAFLLTILLLMTVLGLIALTISRSLYAALLLVPYALWLCFALYLSYKIMILNT